MSRMTVRPWSFLLMPVPVAGVCATCYTWQLGSSSDILAPVSFVAVCAIAFGAAAWGARR